MRITDQAIGRWDSMLVQLGIAREFLKDSHGPCPVCGGKDRFRYDNKDGRGTYFCSQCGPGDGIDLLIKYHGWDFKTAAQEIEKIIGVTDFKPVQVKKDPLPRLKKIAAEAKKLTGNDPVTKYLNARGLKTIPQELNYHEGLDYFEDGKRIGKFKAMLAVVKDVEGNNLTYHVTHLDGDKKANVEAAKKILPPIKPITGGAIRLFGEGEHICVAEGIETAIAAHEITGLPSWAVISVVGMESFQPPEFVKQVTIIADNDKKFSGQKAAYTLANKLEIRHSIKACVIHPISKGNDLCDLVTQSIDTSEAVIYG